MTGAEADASSRSLLEQLGILAKADCLAETLSGGQKRKLCVALALIGDPRIVFLDEPTSGVDPLSRRGMWRLFEREKARRVIALCRNYMDDADILADRIAIMDHGTSLFLTAPTRKRRLCCR